METSILRGIIFKTSFRFPFIALVIFMGQACPELLILSVKIGNIIMIYCKNHIKPEAGSYSEAVYNTPSTNILFQADFVPLRAGRLLGGKTFLLQYFPAHYLLRLF